MVVTGTEQRVYGTLIPSPVKCPCCNWKWTDSWEHTLVYRSITSGYYSPSPFFDAVGTTKFVYENGAWTHQTTLFIPSSNTSVKTIVGQISPDCQEKMDALICKSMVTGFAGYFLNYIYRSQSYRDVSFQMKNSKIIDNVTSVELWIQCDYQSPGYGYVNFYINGEKIGTVFHGNGWLNVVKTYTEPIQITSMILERTSSISNNGSFTINFQGLKINGVCIHSINT